MRGNVFLCLDNTTFNKLIPNELVGTYGIPEYDEEGIQNGVTHQPLKSLESTIVESLVIILW